MALFAPEVPTGHEFTEKGDREYPVPMVFRNVGYPGPVQNVGPSVELHVHLPTDPFLNISM